MYIYIICTWSKSQVSEMLHDAIFPLRTRHQLHYYLRATEEWEANFTEKLYSICLTSCEAWRYQTFVAREHGRLATSPHDTVKGVACETRSESSPLPTSLAVGSTPRAKILCLLALLDVRNTISPCLCVWCTNNRLIISFLPVRTNQSTKISIFCRKRWVYELLGCTNYQKLYGNQTCVYQ